MRNLLLIMPALCFGSLFIVIGLIKIDSKRAILSTASGAIIVASVFHKRMDRYSLIIGVFCGITWGIGFLYQLKVFQKLGASIAVPLTNGLQLLFAAILSLTIFNEIIGLYNISKLVIYMLILILGIILVSKRENEVNVVRENNIRVYLDAIISSIAFIVFMSTNKFFNLSPYALFFPQTIGMFLASLFINRQNIKNVIDMKFILAMLTGLIWFMGNYSVLLSIENFGFGIAIAMLQLNIAVSGILALIVLREKKTKKELIYLMFGIIAITFAGISIAMIN